MWLPAREAGAAREERTALAGLCQALFFARRVGELAVRAHILDATDRYVGFLKEAYPELSDAR